MNDPISGTTKKLAQKIPKPIANAISPWSAIPGGSTVMRTLVLFAPVPPLLKPVLKGYIDGVSTPDAANTARGVTQAAA